MHQIDVSIPRTDREFVDSVIAKADAHGIKMILSDTRSVKYGLIECNGYFVDKPEAQLAVAWRQPTYERSLRILVHESCHMDQWIERADVWNNTTVGDTDTMTILDLWFGHFVELSADQLARYSIASREIELDCERRAVEKIKQWNLPIDLDTYIREANAYVNFYNIFPLTRSWYTIGKEPYNVPYILEHMSTEFDMDYSQATLELIDTYTILFPELGRPSFRSRYIGET